LNLEAAPGMKVYHSKLTDAVNEEGPEPRRDRTT